LQKTLRLVFAALVALVIAVNFFQIISYQPVWQNGETLWQNHILLPHPRVKAYDNLGGYYYAEFTEAFACQDQPRMTAALHKLEIVVEAGLTDFWPDRKQSPPPDTFFLFFLRSLIEEVRGEPESALASLLIADQLHPNFDSTNLNLSRLYHELAGISKIAGQREIYLHAARDRFAEYIKLAYHDRPPPSDVRVEMAGLEAECSALVK
jgi:hypothetical protein